MLIHINVKAAVKRLAKAAACISIELHRHVYKQVLAIIEILQAKFVNQLNKAHNHLQQLVNSNNHQLMAHFHLFHVFLNVQKKNSLSQVVTITNAQIRAVIHIDL